MDAKAAAAAAADEEQMDVSLCEERSEAGDFARDERTARVGVLTAQASRGIAHRIFRYRDRSGEVGVGRRSCWATVGLRYGLVVPFYRVEQLMNGVAPETR